MALTGTDLAVDLNQLMLLGRVDLPMLQFLYATLNSRMAGQPAGTAFTPPPKIGVDPVEPVWTALYDRLQNILGRAAESADQAGHGILHIAAVYEATDTQSAQTLRSLWASGLPTGYLLPDETPLPNPTPAVTIA
jgi:hypothetical protein